MKTQPLEIDPSVDSDLTRVAVSTRKGKLIGEYFNSRLKIEDIIGEGGMGRVFLAYDETIGRRVAIKELLDFGQVSENSSIKPQELKNTFIHEAKLTGKLEHPGIIPIYELGQTKQTLPYYVMPYVKGETLETLLKDCLHLPPNEQPGQRLKLLDILIDSCETVAYAHAKGVIHRDLKPSNIIRGEFGETIVLDWGLAQVLDDKDNTYFYREALKHQRNTLNDTFSSEALGTPCYMAPEQFNGNADKTSDVYSLGVILFRLLCGALPYRGNFEAIQKKISSNKPSPSADTIEKSAPPELVSICNKALHKDQRQRFTNAKEMAEQLKAFRDGRIVNIYVYSRKELLRRFWVRNKAITLLTLALLTTLCIGAGLSFHYAVKMKTAKVKAEKALVTVTAYSETSQKQAKIIAEAIRQDTNQLFSDLHEAAQQLATIDISDQNHTQVIFDQLHSQYPKFQNFVIKPAQAISPESASSWKSSAQKTNIPLTEIRQQSLKLNYRVPVIQNQLVRYFLEAEAQPGQILPDLFPMMSEHPEFRRDIWIMDQDGLIVYDKNKRYSGTNLFLDPQNQNSPALLAFGRLSMTDEDGIGYYSFIENQQQIFKIAAWNEVNFSPSRKWIVIVDYAYMTRKTGKM